MHDQIEILKKDFNNNIQECSEIDSLEKIRVDLLGKKGKLTAMLKDMKNLSIEDKKMYGPLLNEVKDKINSTIEAKQLELKKKFLDEKLMKEKLDITLPSERYKAGSIHPITRVIYEAEQIFAKLGFSVAEGPEVENDFYNFEALNFPIDHPSRDMHDTFYLKTKDKYLLRTHTSNVQIHVMEKFPPPIRVIMPGKVFRSDSDVSHSPVFHQIEGLYVDKKVSFANLKATLQFFIKNFFHKDNKIRLRPSFFPFTEPSVEVDVECVICGGKGCNVCKQTGWLEVLGAGMVDPNVLKNVNISPEEYSGFAFGMGVERLAMLKYGIDNIKLYYENHAYFLEQF
jgi:phenylalanyl-tRNA synthetase alpha chain